MTADSFSSEYVAGFPRMVAYATKHGIPDAENLTQQAWAKAWEHRDQYRGDAAFQTWVYRILLNCIRGERRRSVNRAVDFVADPPERSMVPNYLAALEAETLLGTLRPSQRQALILVYLEGLTLQEVAIRTDRPIGTVKVRVFRGCRAAAAVAKCRIPAPAFRMPVSCLKTPTK